MMSRAEIKAEAKSSFQAQRGTGILLLVVFMLIAAVCGAAGVIVIGGVAGVIIIPVISIGMMLGYLTIYRNETTEINVLFTKFKDGGFARALGGYWWMFLFIYLWSLLLFIPGIIKTMSYFMTPYILAEHPNVPAKEALKLSMRMTKGHLGKIFVAYLSFIGWMMLSGLTFGILYIVYVGPYMATTMAGFYNEIKEEALRDGVVSIVELG